MNERFKVNVGSEIGRLTGVILHEPGPEVASMTPESVERALYSDILNLSVAGSEYAQLKGVLALKSRVFQVRDLLADILGNSKVSHELVHRICAAEGVADIAPGLLEMERAELARMLIEGVPLIKDNLSRFLSRDRYSLPPLHNFFFTRDSAIAVRDQVLIGRMASSVRGREARIMEAIFDYHPSFNARTVNPTRLGFAGPEVTIEGGDVLVASPEILIVGIGARTSPKAVDFLIQRVKDQGNHKHILVQELPHTPESFIHLDMVFTLLDQDCCMAFEPVVMKVHQYKTIHIEIDHGKVLSIREEDHLIKALSALGMDLQVLSCGGPQDRWDQEREQWHSGANFFAMAPGQVIGYGRNQNTIEELDRAGFEVLKARALLKGEASFEGVGRCVVTIDGSELARGGGGCRCMTMPIGREPLG